MPQTIRGYMVEEEVGAGGFGVVYRARQSSAFDREVAIKVIKPHYANEPDFIRRFEAEAQLVSRLEHPFIVPLYDYWRDPNGAYLVMRWLRGGSIEDSLKKGALDVEFTADVLRQIALALTAAHQQGVIHRDVKPSNILLDEHGNAYLADFGIAKDLFFTNGGHTRPDAVIGSPGYLAPEQARHETLSPRTDVYGLGITLFEMLAGEHPFKDANTIDKIYKHLNDPLPELDGLDLAVSDAINAVIQKATLKKPVERYADPLELATAFRAAARLNGALPGSVVATLTRREQEILQQVAEGKSNKEIAAELVVAVSTVRTHLKQAYKKLNVRTRMQAMVKVRDLDLVVDDSLLNQIPESATATYPMLPEAQNPYKGLKPFSAADAKDFFGREALVKQLLYRLEEDHDHRRFLAIIGPSGSGKSSLAKAGLIPAIWRGELAGSDDWYTIDLIPGAHPLDELEVALQRVAGEQTQTLREHLERDARGLVRVGQLVLPDDGSELLILIDQFEEVFTLVEDETRRSHFLDLLKTAVTDPHSRVRIVVTLRADFYDRPLQYPEFGNILRSRMETVLPLSAEELDSAITKPAEQVGVKFADGVVSSIIADVNYQPGALPLLQYALTELFDRREGRIITREAYHATGGTVGALAQRAENLFGELDEHGQVLARQVFLRLVTLGEGTEDTRRRTPLSELLALDDDPDLVHEIVDAYAEYRLLSMDHDPATRRPIVEVAHEAILREWERLRAWLSDSRDDIKLQRQLAALTADWRANTQDASYLVRGSRLEQFRLWAEETQLSLTPHERDFLAASIAAETQREADQQARTERENRLRQQRQRVLQGLVVVFLIAAMGAGGLALFAFDQQAVAQDERDQAEASEQEALRQASIGLAAQAVSELDSNTPERGVLLALEALEHYPYTPQAESALAQTVSATRSHTDLFAASIAAVSFSADGKLIAATDFYDALLWDIESGESQVIGESHLDPLARPGYVDIDWSPDGTRIVNVIASYADMTAEVGTIKVWDMVDRTLLHAWSGHDGEDIWAVDWSNNGAFIVTGGTDQQVRLWDAVTYEERQRFTGHTNTVLDVALAHNDNLLASASSDRTIRIWDVETGETLRTLIGHLGAVNAVSWSPDDSRLISAGDDGLGIIWDAASGDILQTFAGHSAAVADADWSPDGTLIASASADGTTQVWEVASGLVISTFAGSSRAVAWSPDGTTLVVGFGVNGMRAWDMTQRPLRLIGHDYFILDAHWTPDGSHIVTGSFDGTARVWDATTGENTLVYSNHIVEGGPKVVGEVHISADSQWAVTHGGDNNTRVWNIETGEERFVFPIFGGNIFSPDGSKLLIFAWDQAIVVDWESGETILEFAPGFEEFCFFARLSWSPDGRYVATPCPDFGRVDLWDIETGEHVSTVATYDAAVFSTGFSPDGTRLIATDDSGLVHVYDVESGALLYDFAGHTAAVWDAEWSPNGQRIASADETGSVRVWEADTGQQVYQTHAELSPINLNWSPDGTRLIVVGFESVIPEIIPVWQTTDELIADAHTCCVWRNLTPDERAQFGLPER